MSLIDIDMSDLVRWEAAQEILGTSLEVAASSGTHCKLTHLLLLEILQFIGQLGEIYFDAHLTERERERGRGRGNHPTPTFFPTTQLAVVMAVDLQQKRCLVVYVANFPRC